MHRRLVVTVGGIGILLASSLSIGGKMSAAAQSTPPAASPMAATACAATSEDQNVDLIKRWYAAAVSGNGDLSAFLAPNVVYHDLTGRTPDETGSAAGMTWSQMRRADFGDVSVTVDQIIAQNDTVAAFVTWRGKQQANQEDSGIPVTGRQADWPAAGFFRIECGKIAELWTITDDLGKYMDLGVITREELTNAPGTPAATPTP